MELFLSLFPYLSLYIKYTGILINLELPTSLKLTVNEEEFIMARYQTPEEMYRRRKIKRNILYASLIILAIAIIVGLQLLLYSM